MVWECFSRDGSVLIHGIEGIIDGNEHKIIIKDVMLAHGKEKMPRGWIFQPDNPNYIPKVDEDVYFLSTFLKFYRTIMGTHRQVHGFLQMSNKLSILFKISRSLEKHET